MNVFKICSLYRLDLLRDHPKMVAKKILNENWGASEKVESSTSSFSRISPFIYKGGHLYFHLYFVTKKIYLGNFFEISENRSQRGFWTF